jgi:hypothetical protein
MNTHSTQVKKQKEELKQAYRRRLISAVAELKYRNTIKSDADIVRSGIISKASLSQYLSGGAMCSEPFITRFKAKYGIDLRSDDDFSAIATRETDTEDLTASTNRDIILNNATIEVVVAKLIDLLAAQYSKPASEVSLQLKSEIQAHYQLTLDQSRKR